jgi:ProP effector
MSDNKQAELTRAIFVDRWPQTFAGPRQSKRPLKIGIADDIHAAMPELSVFAIRQALGDYTWGRTYCENLKAGTPRIDLDGKPCGEVTHKEETHAQRRLAMFDRNAAAKRHKKPNATNADSVDEAA